jgi:3',5'-cyclic AMP phosphodiesterase CpdA
MTLLLQLSDTHFGTEQPRVVEALVRLVHAQQPDVLMISGDLTQRGTAAQYAAARSFVDRLAVPRVLAIPGNHDIPLFNLPARLLMPYARHRRSFGPELEPQADLPDLLLISVNTTRWWRHVDGSVSRRQVERVAAQLQRAAPGQVRIVVTHQPVSVTRPQDAHNLLHGHRRAIHRWAEAGADLVLGGHIHLPFVRPLHEHMPGLTRRLWAVQAGTAVSSRVRHEAGNSVNLFRIGSGPGQSAADHQSPRHCLFERWDFDTLAQAFSCVDQRGFALAQPFDAP